MVMRYSYISVNARNWRCTKKTTWQPIVWSEALVLLPPNAEGRLFVEAQNKIGGKKGFIRLGGMTNNIVQADMVSFEGSLIVVEQTRWRLLDSGWFKFPSFEDSPVLVWVQMKTEEGGRCCFALATMVIREA